MRGPLLTAFTIRDSAFISDQSREPVVERNSPHELIR
jgi:hypothetical protein